MMIRLFATLPLLHVQWHESLDGFCLRAGLPGRCRASAGW